MPRKKFIVEPHFRLQEWVAEEKGYFKDEGLDYVFQELIQSTDGAHHYKGDKVGAYQSFERGRQADVSCACHWTVGVAASKGKGRLYADVYSVAPAGVFVPADSAIKKPEDLAAPVAALLQPVGVDEQGRLVGGVVLQGAQEAFFFAHVRRSPPALPPSRGRPAAARTTAPAPPGARMPSGRAAPGCPCCPKTRGASRMYVWSSGCIPQPPRPRTWQS